MKNVIFCIAKLTSLEGCTLSNPGQRPRPASKHRTSSLEGCTPAKMPRRRNSTSRAYSPPGYDSFFRYYPRALPAVTHSIAFQAKYFCYSYTFTQGACQLQTTKEGHPYHRFQNRNIREIHSQEAQNKTAVPSFGSSVCPQGAKREKHERGHCRRKA